MHVHICNCWAPYCTALRSFCGVFPVLNELASSRTCSELRRLKTYLCSTMGQQRVSNIALINTEREYASSVVNKHIFGRRNEHRYIWPSIKVFMSSFDRFICKNIFKL